MPHLDGTGPDGKSAQSGRKLGNCVESAKEELFQKLGKGERKRRHSGGGNGNKKRLKSSSSTEC
jgi:hypothetical protein